jgi:hypothetical protein
MNHCVYILDKSGLAKIAAKFECDLKGTHSDRNVYLTPNGDDKIRRSNDTDGFDKIYFDVDSYLNLCGKKATIKIMREKRLPGVKGYSNGCLLTNEIEFITDDENVADSLFQPNPYITKTEKDIFPWYNDLMEYAQQGEAVEEEVKETIESIMCSSQFSSLMPKEKYKITAYFQSLTSDNDKDKTSAIIVQGETLKERIEKYQYYPMPHAKFVKAILEQENMVGSIWECCCGKLDVVNALKEHGYDTRHRPGTTVIASDIADYSDLTDGIGAIWNNDFLKTSLKVNNIFTAPAWGDLKDKIIEHALEVATDKVIMLFPNRSMNAKKRFGLRPSRIYQIVGKIKFHPNSEFSYSDDCSWYVWDKTKPFDKCELRKIMFNKNGKYEIR